MSFRSLTAALLVLLTPSALYAGQFESASTFQAEDCERYLSGPSGTELLKKAKDWLKSLPEVTILSPRRVDKPREVTTDSVVLNPKLVWFMEHPGSTYDEVLQRYHEARDRSDQYHLNMVRSLPSPTHDQILADIAKREQKQREFDQQTLTPLEMAALGVPDQEPVTMGGMHAELILESENVLRLELKKEEEVIGGLRLPVSSLRAGFRNVIPIWQASQLEGDEPDLESPVAPEDRRKDIEQFLNEHGQFALFHKSGEFLFAYDFGMLYLESDPTQVSGLTLDIFVAKPCSEAQMAETEFTFPPMTRGQPPLCFSDTFFKLRVPRRQPSTMNVEQPAGFSERKFQL